MCMKIKGNASFICYFSFQLTVIQWKDKIPKICNFQSPVIYHFQWIKKFPYITLPAEMFGGSDFWLELEIVSE